MFDTGIGIGVIGFAVGLLVGMTGTGGGALTVSLLIFGMGMRPITAVGTDLVFLSALKVIGAWAHHRHQNVDWRLVKLFAVGSVPGALAGVVVLSQVRSISEATVDLMITRLLGVVLIATAIAVLAKFAIGERRIFRFLPQARESQDAPSPRFTISLGFVVGVLVSLTSVGGGTLVAAALMTFYGLSGRRIVGTDVAHAVILTSVAAAGHVATQSVNLPVAMTLLVGAVPGVLLGSRFTVHIPDRGLRAVLASVLLAAGIRLI